MLKHSAVLNQFEEDNVINTIKKISAKFLSSSTSCLKDIALARLRNSRSVLTDDKVHIKVRRVAELEPNKKQCCQV